MLNGLSGQDSINKNLLQSGSVDKLSLGKNNPYANAEKNLLIDESSISNEALTLYQRDLDIRKFASLAMSNPEDLSHNVLVAQNVFGKGDSDFETNILESIFNNRTFLNDLFS